VIEADLLVAQFAHQVDQVLHITTETIKPVADHRLYGVIRWALDRVAYALAVILFSAVVVAVLFASAGVIAAVALWVMRNIT
jgi:hypothetical protein